LLRPPALLLPLLLLYLIQIDPLMVQRMAS
jgi:hypothetical protein